jgi:zinc/manganese transport system permease protein
VFLLILDLTVAEEVQVVGVILVFTLLIIPDGAAQRLTAHPGLAVVYSVTIALVATLGGLVCAIYTSWPVSFFVSAFAFLAYLLARAANAMAMRTVKGPLAKIGAVDGRSVTRPSSSGSH